MDVAVVDRTAFSDVSGSRTFVDNFDWRENFVFLAYLWWMRGIFFGKRFVFFVKLVWSLFSLFRVWRTRAQRFDFLSRIIIADFSLHRDFVILTSWVVKGFWFGLRVLITGWLNRRQEIGLGDVVSQYADFAHRGFAIMPAVEIDQVANLIQTWTLVLKEPMLGLKLLWPVCVDRFEDLF